VYVFHAAAVLTRVPWVVGATNASIMTVADAPGAKFPKLHKTCTALRMPQPPTVETAEDCAGSSRKSVSQRRSG
jgi:hypothetical protein